MLIAGAHSLLDRNSLLGAQQPAARPGHMVPTSLRNEHASTLGDRLHFQSSMKASLPLELTRMTFLVYFEPHAMYNNASSRAAA